MKKFFYGLLPVCLLALLMTGCDDTETVISIGESRNLVAEISTQSAAIGDEVTFSVKIDQQDNSLALEEDIDVVLTFTGKNVEGKEVAASDVFDNFSGHIYMKKGEKQGFTEFKVKNNLAKYPVSGAITAYVRGYKMNAAERPIVLSDKHYTIMSLKNNSDNTVKEYGYFVLLATVGAPAKEDVTITINAGDDADKYETLHLLGHKRVWPYRFDAQERALMGGMRGVAFSALLGLSDFRKDALASALHVYYLQRKYPHAEMSLSCPRLRPIINNDQINPLDVHEKQLCQILCAYRIFLPFVGITVSSRESAQFRNGIVKIAATKVSAGVSTGVGDHDNKYNGTEADAPQGDEQFEINDGRSLEKMYQDIEGEGLQPVLNDYLYM